MFDFIKKIGLGRNGVKEAANQDDVDAHLALAVLMIEAAYADGECSEEERTHMAETLIKDFGVTREDIDHLIELGDKKHKEYVDLFSYTRIINDNFSEAQKLEIIESVWRIILLDGHLEAHEDHFAHKLANLLDLNHGELIEAKLKARKQIS